MSDVIRQAVIELSLRLKNEKLSMDGGFKRAYEDQTKAAKEAQKQTEQNIRAMREAARVHEEFGHRSSQAFAHGLHSAVQFGRGLALMAASGEEDTRKLLENLVKIEAAAALTKGTAGLIRFASAFGALGIAATGAGAVLVGGLVLLAKYNSEVDRETKRIEDMIARYRDLRSKADELARSTESARNKGAEEQSEETMNPADRAKARGDELARIHQRRGEMAQQVKDSEVVRQNSERQAQAEETKQRKIRGAVENMTTAEKTAYFAGKTAAGWLGHDPEGDIERSRVSAVGRAGRAAKTGAGFVRSEIEDAAREKDILKRERDDNIKQEREREKIQLDSLHKQLHPAPGTREAGQVAQAQAVYDALQRKLGEQFRRTGIAPSGYENGRTFEEHLEGDIQSRTRNNINTIERDSEAAIKAVAKIMTDLKVQLEALQTQATQAQQGNAG